MSEKKSKKLVPQLRFKGFTNPWEQRKLGEIGDTYPGLSGKSKEDFGHGDARYITYLNVYQNAVANQDMTDPIEVDNRQHKIRHGDIFFTTSSETPEEVGLSSVWPYNGNNIYLNSFCFGYRLRERINLQFIAHSLRAPQMRSKFIKLAQGISRFNISKTKLMEEFIGMPTANEQDQLGDFFETLDSLIAAHERKLGLLKKKKTYYLQQIFGQKLRFKGFSEPWEQRKLGQIISITSAVRVHRDEWTSTGIRFFRSSDVAATYRNEPNSSAYISLKRFEELTADSGSPQRGDLLVTGGGSIGIPYVVKDILPLYFKDADLLWLHQTPMLGSKFLYYFLTSPINRRYLAKVSHIGTISHYTIEQASNTPIVIPTVQEQSRISDLLEQLSSLIAVHEQKLSLLKKKKQAYLQKMFV